MLEIGMNVYGSAIQFHRFHFDSNLKMAPIEKKFFICHFANLTKLTNE